MTNFQGEEELAYHGVDNFLSMPVAASLGRRGETKWSFLAVNTQAGEHFRICGFVWICLFWGVGFFGGFLVFLFCFVFW